MTGHDVIEHFEESDHPLTMQHVIVWLEGEIVRLKRSPTCYLIADNIARLERELARLKAEYPGEPINRNHTDAAITL